MNDTRPNPDALLQAVQTSERRRGRLKIFFGSCAGVGKTYAMLAAARERLQDGDRVMIGVVEAHGRGDTLRMLEAIPALAQRAIEHHGISVSEFDLDAALSVNPNILLLDELAHTNAAGSRHPKRWQDVVELLDAGINIYTTLNVQHLESLNDLVASITGIAVRETIPDSVFDQADDIVLVDIPPDELLKRLREGKVYLSDEVRSKAAENFFKKSNLTALRELALRRTAERVDAQMDDSRLLEGIRRDTAGVANKLMVCVGADPLSARLVRSTRRLAHAMKAPWVAVYVETSLHDRLNERAKRGVQTILRLAERIGGRTVVLQGNDVVDELMSYARANGITKIVVGKSQKSRWMEFVAGSLVEKIIHASGNDVDVYIVTGDGYKRKEILAKPDAWKGDFWRYGYAVCMLAVCTLMGMVLESGFGLKPTDLVMIYLIGGVPVAVKWGRWPSILYSLLSVNFFNFFFIEPRYTLNVYDSSYWITFAVMLATSLVITTQASQLRLQAIFARKRESDTNRFYALTRELASIRGHHNMAEATAKQIEDTFSVSAIIWVPDPHKNLVSIVGKLLGADEVKEMSVVQWCFDHAEKAGYETMTMPSAKGFYLPLVTNDGTRGVLGVVSKLAERSFSLEEVSILETFASLLASSFERASTSDAAEKSKVEAEKEKLRNILLSSVSHDLRTPLASIIGSSSSIMNDAALLPKETLEGLARGIHDEAQRLARIVTNLLDVTRFESGHVQLNLQPYYIEELIGAALTQLKPLLIHHKIVTQAEPDLPMVTMDGTLVEQVLVNLLTNAARYTPADTVITLSAAQKNGHILVTVADQGPGIPAGEEEKIFDKFYIIGKRKGQGTGLGLAVCHGIIVAHKGKIWVENNPKEGASFCFTLPVDASELRGAEA